MNSFAEYMVPVILLTNLIMAVIGAALVKYSRDKGLRALSLLLIFAMVVQLVQLVLTYNKISSVWLFYVYPPIEFGAVVYFLLSIEDKYNNEIKLFAIGAGALAFVAFLFSVQGYPVYSLVIFYLTLTIICARVFFISNNLVVLGLLLFAALESVVLSSFVIPGLAATRILQPVVNLFSNIIIIVGLYGRIRQCCNVNDGSMHGNNSAGNNSHLLQTEK